VRHAALTLDAEDEPRSAPFSPGSTLTEEQWRALSKAYAAGDWDLDAHVNYANIRPETWLQLQMRDFENGALVVEVQAPGFVVPGGVAASRPSIDGSPRWPLLL
jgi:hypothetical protein